MNKLHFLQHDFIAHLKTIDEQCMPAFGKMNVHQMIEHMSYAFQQASGLIPLKPLNDENTTQKMYAFMMSDKPFRDNTPNPYLPDEPEQPKHETIALSIEALQKDILVFIDTFSSDETKRVTNPFFGNLNFEEWQNLLHKHALHHLRQFNVIL
jgi:hypothetical protein